MTPNNLKNERLNEEIHFAELENGLKIFFMPKNDYLKKYAIFATNYGSNDNRFIPIGESEIAEFPAGIAHFLEHKLFEEPEGNIFNEFSKLGSYVNAFTNFNQTAYLFSCTDKFYENLELLVKFVQNPYFTDENVEKEKGIIEQEIRMYDDSANWKVFFNCLDGLYHKHPVKVDIAGTVESIYKITKEDLYNCYNTFYHPSNMILFMIGDIEFDKAFSIIKNNQRDDLKSIEGEIVKEYPEEPESINKLKVEESLSVSTPLFNIGFKDLDIGFGGEDLVRKQLVTSILLEMLMGESSEFYQKLYDEGLINNSFGTQYVGHKNYGHSIIGGESEKAEKVLSEILSYLEEKQKSGLNKENFQRIKQKYIGYYFMDFNSIEYIATTFVNQYFNGSSLMKYLDILEGIKFKDVEKRFNQHLTSDNYTLSLITPK
ncbi:EF-P 5-aminopentanol modification-associated protein YfmH [Sporosalibacterium faouarense]|uniref:EF-P 5-aminopentanol modification-associated protein YfmH n=1 Tax=Sporosalibacterium faouarense TaxID=516123 RepID=UPI00192AE541